MGLSDLTTNDIEKHLVLTEILLADILEILENGDKFVPYVGATLDVTLGANSIFMDSTEKLDFGSGKLTLSHDNTDGQLLNTDGTFFINNDAGDKDIDMGASRLLLDESGTGAAFAGTDSTLVVSNVGGSTGTPVALGFALEDGGNSPSLLAQFGLGLLNGTVGGGFDHSSTVSGFFGGVFGLGPLTNTVANIAGGFYRVNIPTSGATYTNVFGLTARIGVTGATMANLVIYGGTLENNLGSTITNAFGLLLPNISIGTNNFAINTGLGIVSFGDDLQMRNDGDKILLGALQDLEFLHDGTDSQIVNNTGDLLITNSTSSKDIIFNSLNSTKTIGGRIVDTIRITASTHTITTVMDHIYYDTDSNAIASALPVGVDGQKYRIINSGTSSNDVTISPNGAELLTGSNSSRTLSDQSVIILTYETTEGWY